MNAALTPEQLAVIAERRPKLRAFQQDAKDRLRMVFQAAAKLRADLVVRSDRRVLVVAPTGAGKGTMAVDLILDAVIKGHVVMFVVHRAEIIIDLVDRLAAAGLTRVSVILGGDNRHDPYALVHIASIDSLRTRALPPATLIIIDEAHRAHSGGYQKLLERYPEAYICALTATPCRLDGKPLKYIFPHLIVAVQPSVLLAQGLLAPAEVYTVARAEQPDLEGVGTVAGDYDPRQLASRMNTPKLVGAIVTHWQRAAHGRATVVFAVNVEHSKKIVAMFVEAGIAAEHVDGKATRNERIALMKRVRSGETLVVCQCQLWIEGVDLPELKCAILARPTKSLTVYLQSVGRVFRPYDDQHAVVLDHAGMVNKRGFGLPQTDRDWQAIFDADPKEKTPGSMPPIKICPPEENGCGMVVPLGTRVCKCGHEFPASSLEAAEGELVEVTTTQTKAQIAALKAAAKKDPRGEAARAAFDRYWREAYARGYDDAWVMRRFAERFGDAPDAAWPPPERPKIAYTIEQKKAERMTLMSIAHRNGKSPAWVAERYRLKIGEDIAALDAPAAKALPAPSADDVPALPQGEVIETEF